MTQTQKSKAIQLILQLVNMGMVAAIDKPANEESIAIAKRQLNVTSSTLFVIAMKATKLKNMQKSGVGQVMLSDMKQLDGEYVLVVVPSNECD